MATLKPASTLVPEDFAPVKGADITVPAIVLGERGRGRVLTPVVVDPGALDNGCIVAPVRIGETRSGKPKIQRGEGIPSAWLDHVCTLTSYVRDAYGWVGKLNGSNVEVIARGLGAFGDAGRIGTWGDYLLSVPPRTWVRVKPSRGAAYFLWYPDLDAPGRVKVAEDALDAFCEGVGIAPPPTERDSWEKAEQ